MDLSVDEFFYGKNESHPLLDMKDPENIADPHDLYLSNLIDEKQRSKSMRGSGGRVFIFPTI